MSPNIRTVLVDLSGTIHIEDQVIPGAIEAIEGLRHAGLNVKFATNTTKESRRLLCQRLNRIGFNVQQEQIFTSLTAARDYVMNHKLKPYLLVDDAALEDFESVVPVDTRPDDADAVLIGLAPDKFDYEYMNNAMRILNRGSHLIAIHRSRYFKSSAGLKLGPGLFVSALEFATGCQPVVVGKPNESFFLQAIREFECQPNQCVIIGDDVRDDVLGGQSAGLIGILVQTGKYRTGDECGVVDGKTGLLDKPHHVYPSIVEAVEAILEGNI